MSEIHEIGEISYFRHNCRFAKGRLAKFREMKKIKSAKYRIESITNILMFNPHYTHYILLLQWANVKLGPHIKKKTSIAFLVLKKRKKNPGKVSFTFVNCI